MHIPHYGIIRSTMNEKLNSVRASAGNLMLGTWSAETSANIVCPGHQDLLLCKSVEKADVVCRAITTICPLASLFQSDGNNSRYTLRAPFGCGNRLSSVMGV